MGATGGLEVTSPLNEDDSESASPGGIQDLGFTSPCGMGHFGVSPPRLGYLPQNFSRDLKLGVPVARVGVS